MKRFPWHEESAHVAYASHVLEYFRFNTERRFIEETHRCLIPAGIIRVVVPDLALIVGEFAQGRLTTVDLVEILGVLYTDYDSPVKQRLARFVQVPHQCMYDVAALLSLVRDVGFDVAERASFDSEIPDIDAIEQADRTVNVVVVEGTKI